MRSAIFRCDASAGIGGGHVMRCLTLAKALARKGWSIRFACLVGTADAVPALASAGFSIIPLCDPLNAEEVVAKVGHGVDVSVVDNYALDARHEAVFREAVPFVMVIDDIANRSHDCDMLLDQTFGRRADAYRGLVPIHATVLAGSIYALLRPEFAAARPRALARRVSMHWPVRRILISFGLTDVGGVTAEALLAVLSANTGAAIDVVLGPSAPSLAVAKALVADHPKVTLHDPSVDMCRLMVAADLAVGAAGTTSWERCCLGLPTITLALVENQKIIARNLEAEGATVNAESALPETLGAKLKALVSDPKSLRQMSIAAARMADGRGAGRVIATLDAKVRGRH